MAVSLESPIANNAAIAFVGGGNMARSLIGALTRHGSDPARIAVAEPVDALREQLHADFGVRVFSDAASAVQGADIVLLAVKPQVMRQVCETIGAVIAARKPLIISIAAGLRMEQMDAWLGGGFPIVRAMPNTPALIGAGATGMIANARVDAGGRGQAQAILANAGRTAWIDEEAQMDAVTGVSGSGPAYYFLLIESLEYSVVEQGLPRDTARQLAIQTCLGAARMASEDGEAPARLRERVTSPNGTTAAALKVLGEGDLRGLMARAVAAATQRGGEMSKELD